MKNLLDPREMHKEKCKYFRLKIWDLKILLIWEDMLMTRIVLAEYIASILLYKSLI